MALVLNEATNNSEDIGKVIAKVQNDIQCLRTATIKDGDANGVDLHELELILSRTEQSMQVLAEKALQSSQNKVNTLPAVAYRARASTQPVSHYRSKSGPHISNRQRKRRVGGDGCGLSPGQASQVQHLSHLVSKPSHPVAHQLISEHYNLFVDHSIHLQKHRQELHTARAQQLARGTTAHHLATLPRANRRDALLTPPTIQPSDAQRGLLSLLERGLIPPAAELMLSPPPVFPHKARLHRYGSQHGLRPLIAADTTLASVRLDPLHSTHTLPLIHMPTHKSTSSATRHTSLNATPAHVYHNSHLVSARTIEPPFPAANIAQHTHSFPVKTRDVCNVIIHNGKIAVTTEKFLLFKEREKKQWTQIAQVLNMVVKICKDYSLPVCILDCEKLVKMSLNHELDLHITKTHLLSIMTNKHEVQQVLSTPGQRYKGTDRKIAAANKIRATFLMHKTKKEYKNYLKKKWAANVVGMSWTMYARLYGLRQRLRSVRATQLEAHRQRLADLRKSWSCLKSARRTIVHIPSLGYPKSVRRTVEDMEMLQSLQIGRLCDLKDGNVEVIYVSPVTLGQDTLDYYYNLLSVGNYDSQALKSRLHILIPENLKAFKSYNLPLSSVLLYSPVCLARIKRLLAGRQAYIVPGTVCTDDITLSDKLKLPLLGSEPDTCELYSSKPGTRCLIQDTGVPMPPFVADIFSKDKMIERLSILIANHLTVSRWLFKLPHQIHGRGFAYCDVGRHLPCYTWLLKEAQRYGTKWHRPWAQQYALKKITSELPAMLDSHAHTTSTTLYPQWSDFLKHFLEVGGVIEATPPSESVTSVAVDVLIEPTGEFQVLSTLDQICSESYEVWGGSSPQCCVPHHQLMETIQRIAIACKERSILGHISLDLVTFIDPQTMQQTLWCVDIDLGYSNTLALQQLTSYVTGLQHDPNTGSLLVKNPQQEHTKTGYTVLMPRLHHGCLSFLYPSIFFQLCKAHLIGFNHKVKRGTFFCLSDEQHRDYLSMVCVEDNLQGAMATFHSNLTVIHQEISIPTVQRPTNFKAICKVLEDIIELMEVNSK